MAMATVIALIAIVMAGRSYYYLGNHDTRDHVADDEPRLSIGDVRIGIRLGWSAHSQERRMILCTRR